MIVRLDKIVGYHLEGTLNNGEKWISPACTDEAELRRMVGEYYEFDMQAYRDYTPGLRNTFTMRESTKEAFEAVQNLRVLGRKY